MPNRVSRIYVKQSLFDYVRVEEPSPASFVKVLDLRTQACAQKLPREVDPVIMAQAWKKAYPK